MDRVSVTTDEAAFIRERVRRFDQEAPEGVRKHQADSVRRHQALPLFFGWTETLAIREDGVLVRWVTEDWPGAQEFDERTWVNLALVQGAARYPELKGLIPRRPEGAETCPSCSGAGTVPGHSAKLICSCGGTGWLLPAAGPDIEEAGRPTTR